MDEFELAEASARSYDQSSAAPKWDAVSRW